MIISRKKLAELLTKETAQIRSERDGWIERAANERYIVEKLQNDLAKEQELCKTLNCANGQFKIQLSAARTDYELILKSLTEYKDAIGDISEALNSISPTIRLNALKQIRDRIARLNVGK